MKKLSFYFFLISIIVLFGFNSCTIKKRLYKPGYYVEWHNVNRKSKANKEIESKKCQETVCEEKIVVENNVKKIEDRIQPIAIQKLEPVYASNDENTSNIEIINSTQQKNTFSTNTKKVKSKIYASVIKEKTTKSPGITKGAKKMHCAAIVGLLLSILGATAAIFSTIAPSMFLLLCLTIGSFLLIIAGMIFSYIAITDISQFPGMYRGKLFAYTAIIIDCAYIFILLGMIFLVIVIL